MKYVPKEETENVNVSKGHPIADLTKLLAVFAVLIGVFYLALGFAADFISENLSPANEVRFFGKETKPSSVQSLVDRLWKNYPQSEGFKLSGRIEKMSTPNAFMELGGNVSVTSELLNGVESENELAFVICHEIGHFYHRHVIHGVGRALVFGLLLSLIDASGLAQGFIEAGVGVAQLSFSRGQEAQADSFALDCLNQEFGHVNGFDHFFLKMQKRHESDQSPAQQKLLSYISTHPNTGDRIEIMKENIRRRGLKVDGPLANFNQ